MSSLDNANEKHIDKLTLPNFKIYCKATIIKRTWYLKVNRHTDKWSKMRVHKQTYANTDNLILFRGIKAHYHIKESFTQQIMRVTMDDHKVINEQRYKLCVLDINSLKVTHCGKYKIKNYKNYSGIPRVKSTWVRIWWLVFTSNTNSTIHERKNWWVKLH